MAYKRIKTPFVNLSFTPDLPANELGVDDYRNGLNVETDRRSIRKILGDESILSQIPSPYQALYMTGGFRYDASGQPLWTFIVACSNPDTTTDIKVFAITDGSITDVTPAIYSATQDSTVANQGLRYATAWDRTTLFSDDWSGGVCFLNAYTPGGINNPPMYLVGPVGIYGTNFYVYDDTVNPPGVYRSFTWNYTYTDANLGTARFVSARFIRVYNSPNLGNILIAGNLEYEWSLGTTTYAPITLRWSQQFTKFQGTVGTVSTANYGAPATWQPTLYNVANEVDLPLRGDIVDGFSFSGNFYIMSYWDTVVMLPISYTTSTAPVFAIKLFNQGRGLLSNNCWINTDNNVYGIDSRDVWVFDGANFQSLGNQKVKDYIFQNISRQYASRVFVTNNTLKNQFELYYPDLTSTGQCNRMLSYRYDLQVWNPPREINQAVHAIEAPIYEDGSGFNLTRRGTVYLPGGVMQAQITQKDIGNTWANGAPISSVFEKPVIEFPDVVYSQKVFTHRVMPEIYGNANANVNIAVGGSDSINIPLAYSGNIVFTLGTPDPWVQIQQNASRITSFQLSETGANLWRMTTVSWLYEIVQDDF